MKKNYILPAVCIIANCLLPTVNCFSQMVVDTFSFTGSQQIYVVPTLMLGNDSIQVDVRGAQGGIGGGNTGVGGNGGRVYGNIKVIPGDTLYVFVGGINGYNGGGTGTGSGGDGGGASDIRQGGTGLNNRIVVAGGGGGAGSGSVNTCDGGWGGGNIGIDGESYSCGTCNDLQGIGGTQTSGGLGGNCGGVNGGLGFGGSYGTTTGGGGGGGYYGGGSGAATFNGSCTGIGSGGGGGSSLVPNGCNTTSGFWNGDGIVIISYDTCGGSYYNASIIKTNVSCYGGNNGSATASVSGGTSPYTYLWSNGQTTQIATGLVAGNYSVTVTGAVGCTRTASVTILQPSSALATPTVTNTPAGCNPPNGTATANTSGGVSPYTFLWSDGQTAQTATGLAAGGTYFVTITDSWGCSITGFTTMPSPNVPAVYISSVNPASCYGQCNGSAGGYALGGTPPYTYQWSTVPVQSNSTATGLCAGAYNLSVVDNWGCVNTNSATANIQAPPQIIISLSSSSASCGNPSGSMTASVAGGIAPYVYNWSNGNTTSSATGLYSGSYTFTVTDAGGCTASKSDSVSVVTASNPVCVVTVDSTSTKNVLVWDKPIATNIASFRIYRDISSVFTQIGSVPYSSLSAYTDFNIGVDPNITSYQYKITVVDTCGNESAMSAFHKTIHVAVSPASPCGYNLFWNDYIGFPVSKYRILRDTTGTYNWVAVDSVSFGNNAWTDNSCNLPFNTAYLVEVIVPGGGCESQRVGNAGWKDLPVVPTATINTTKSNTFKTGATGVNENALENLVRIFPNPFAETATLRITNGNALRITDLKLFDVVGQEHKMEFIRNSAGFVIRSGEIASGIYFLKIISDKGIMVKKIVINH